MIDIFLCLFCCQWLHGSDILHEANDTDIQLRANHKIFLATEVSKDIVYQGESIDVRYYMYYRQHIIQKEFLTYPQFNSFIKRFIRPDSTVETVEYHGKKYQRSLEYQVRLFPEEVGKFTINSLSSRVYYLESGGNSFGQFGQQFQHQVSEDLQSPIKEITVLPLPLVRQPPSFTGLIGKHKIEINIEKKIFSTNSPIEIGLSITGPGALEKLDPPILLNVEGLEQFHTKGELFYQDQKISTRMFIYTYIAQKELHIKKHAWEFFYFDPDLTEYKKIVVNLPALTIQSDLQSLDIPLPNDPDPQSRATIDHEGERGQNDTGILPPNFTPEFQFLQLVDGIIILFWSVLLVIVFLIVSPLLFRITANDRELKVKLWSLARNGTNYHELFNLFCPYGSGQNLKDLITSLPFEAGVSNYLLELVDKLTEKSYSVINDTTRIKIEKKYLVIIFNTLRNNANNR